MWRSRPASGTFRPPSAAILGPWDGRRPDLTEPLAALRADPASAAVLCDIDGTLSPIVADPEAADRSRTGAGGCWPSSRAATGWSPASAAAAPAPPAAWSASIELTYAGNHGLEVLRPGDTAPTLDPELGHRGTAAASFASRLDWRHLDGCGLRLEDKGPIQAIHWRGADDPELAGARAEEIAALAAEQGLVPHFGRMVLELRPLATVDKGIAVRRLISEERVRTAALYGGDDRTDLDAFAALRGPRGRRHARAPAVLRRRRVRGGSRRDPLGSGPGGRRPRRLPRRPAGALDAVLRPAAGLVATRRRRRDGARRRHDRRRQPGRRRVRARGRRSLVADRRRRRPLARPPGAGGRSRSRRLLAGARTATHLPAETPGPDRAHAALADRRLRAPGRRRRLVLAPGGGDRRRLRDR